MLMKIKIFFRLNIKCFWKPLELVKTVLLLISLRHKLVITGACQRKISNSIFLKERLQSNQLEKTINQTINELVKSFKKWLVSSQKKNKRKCVIFKKIQSLHSFQVKNLQKTHISNTVNTLNLKKSLLQLNIKPSKKLI